MLLDFVANRKLRLRARPGLATRRSGRACAPPPGASAWRASFPSGTQGTVLDDHTPFLRAGVPAIDLIDFDFPLWHSAATR